jgi:hypothetical protein
MVFVLVAAVATLTSCVGFIAGRWREPRLMTAAYLAGFEDAESLYDETPPSYREVR